MKPTELTLAITDSLENLSAAEWNALVSPGNPFMEYEFLNSFALAEVVGVDTNWHPQYLTAHKRGQLVGVIPLYIKFDSYGEFIWDFEWAQAFQRAGMVYYPKATVAVPFTPATGERILVHPAEDYETVAAAMLSHLWQWVREQKLSSLHFLFITQREQKFLEGQGFMPRLSFQYHWHNHHYQTFEDWLNSLKAKKAGEVRRERRRVAELKLDIQILTGNQITLVHLQAMAEFYEDTCSRKWGPPRLNVRWFELMYELEACRNNLVLVMASQAGKLVAGTINFRKGAHLYGRYWGCLGEFPYLHFECCYYQLIEYAIREKIQLYEAGAQGEHKFIRGFDAQPTYSAHGFVSEQASAGISRFLQAEKLQMDQILAEYQEASAYKRSGSNLFLGYET